LGLLIKIPRLGTLISRLVIAFASRKDRHITLPSIRAGKRIVPQYIRSFTPIQLAATIKTHYLDNEEQDEMRRNFATLRGNSNTAESIMLNIAESIKD
jgi:lipid A disaccharide synthetase